MISSALQFLCNPLLEILRAKTTSKKEQIQPLLFQIQQESRRKTIQPRTPTLCPIGSLTHKADQDWEQHSMQTIHKCCRILCRSRLLQESDRQLYGYISL